jgi:GNAT superfamily N-acetyltransferase
VGIGKMSAIAHRNRAEQLLNEIHLVPLSPSHIDDIARLHYRILPWSFNGQFGQAHITDLYRALCRSPYFFGYVYYRGGEIVGFVTATSDFEDTRRHVLNIFKHKIWQSLKIFMRHPRFFLTAFESKLLVPLVFRRFGCRAEWLTFVTDTEKSYLVPLVAMRMIDQVRKHFSDIGVKAYMAQGFRDNPRAIQLYEKLRWRVVARLPMHNIYYYPTETTSNESRPEPAGGADGT